MEDVLNNNIQKSWIKTGIFLKFDYSSFINIIIVKIS